MAEQYVTVKNTLVLIFILFTLYAVTLWNLPHEDAAGQKRLNTVRGYMRYTGLWQNWNMFSPDVVAQSNHVRIIASTKNGDITYEPEYGYGAMRRIKFLENILGSPSHLEPFLKSVCTEFGATNATLYIKKQPIKRFEETTVEEAPYVQDMTVTC